MPEPAFTTRVTRAGDAAWATLESEVLRGRHPLPLPARAAWHREHGEDARLVTAHDASGAAVGAVAVEVAPARALPGHKLLRALHTGAALSGPAGAALALGLRKLARTEPRVLRVNVELVLRTPEEHAVVASRLSAVGFTRVARIRHYTHTLVVDLAGTEDEILASFSQTTRRDLRAWSERPVEMRPISDARYADRLNALARETFARTGGVWHPRPWPARIALCAAEPNASRLVGLFRAGRDDPDALLAYAWGCNHGDHVHYDDAGSTRVDDIKVSMMYPLMWDLIRWAKQQGCAWFDMGGAIEAGATDDPRAGISDFKRRFSKVMVEVGAEWEYEPHPARAALARLTRAALSRLRR